GEVEAFDRVGLHDLDDRAGEVPADVAEPARDVRGRTAEPGRPGARPLARRVPGAIQRGQRRVDAGVVPRERDTGTLLRLAAEDEPPAPHPFVGGAHRATSLRSPAR